MEPEGKTPGQVLQAGKTQQQHGRQQSSPEHRKVMLVMWTAMARAFGNWVPQYGTSEEGAFRSWSQKLQAYTPEQIQRGVRNATDRELWNKDFPPNLPQFEALCLTDAKRGAGYHAVDSPKRLERFAQRADRSIIDQEFRIIRRIVESGFTESREDACRALGLDHELPSGEFGFGEAEA